MPKSAAADRVHQGGIEELSATTVAIRIKKAVDGGC